MSGRAAGQWVCLVGWHDGGAEHLSWSWCYRPSKQILAFPHGQELLASINIIFIYKVFKSVLIEINYRIYFRQMFFINLFWVMICPFNKTNENNVSRSSLQGSNPCCVSPADVKMRSMKKTLDLDSELYELQKHTVFWN